MTNFKLLQEARRSLLNESVVDSPFYAGRTTYGGTSAYRRATLQPTTMLFTSVRKLIHERPSSNSSAPTHSGSTTTTTSSSVVLSSSAQRILQALESMSTPIRDDKRIHAASISRRSTSFHEEDVSFSGEYSIQLWHFTFKILMYIFQQKDLV